MNQLDVGLDKGFSKVNLVVVDADQQILREAHIERIDRTGRLISDRRLLQLIAQHLIPFRAYQLHLFGSHLGTTRSFFGSLRSYGLNVQVLEAFNDTHMHYGLTHMPGNVITIACGSYWNAMYYDSANNVHCFAGDIWKEIPWSFSGIAFARFLLGWWRDVGDKGETSPFAVEILARTGLSHDVLLDALDPALKLDSLPPACWLALGPLVSKYATRPEVTTFLNRGLCQLRYLFGRFSDQAKPPDTPLLILGGSIWSDTLFEQACAALTDAGIDVIRSQGNPALGAIRFRHLNSAVQLEPWAYRIIV